LRRIVLSFVLIAGTPLGAFAQSSAPIAQDLSSCMSKAGDQERLACFDALSKSKAAILPEADRTANTKEVLADKKEFKVVDAEDVYVSPGKYIGRPIELRRVHCFHADKDDYRCIASGQAAVLIEAPTIEPSIEKSAIEENCGEIKKVSSARCVRTIRLVPISHAQDMVSFGVQRTGITAASIEVVTTTVNRKNR
jgi:hypothetical protein